MKAKVVAFDNSDKKKAEKWDDKKDKHGNLDLANFPCPFRCLLLGPPNSGKSNLIKNLIIHQKPRINTSEEFNTLYKEIQIHPTYIYRHGYI